MVSSKDTEAHTFTGATEADAATAQPTDASADEQARLKRRLGHERSHDGDLPETYGRDEVEILPKDPHWYFIYWEVTDAGLKAAEQQLGLSDGDGKLVLRVFVTTYTTPGGKDHREIRDLHLHARHGKKYLESPRAGAHLRAAVGLLTTEGLFAPIAQSQPLRLPPTQPSTDTAVEWAHVQPGQLDGKQREHILISRPERAHKERALPWRTGSAPHASQLPVSESEWIVDAPTGQTSSGNRPPGKSGGL
ncbi:MAG: DUF4912 domain-containing protein [Myxococcales bacterium]|nr:DUF4912 domain-containing protein [Myxococcales bacterium]